MSGHEEASHLAVTTPRGSASVSGPITIGVVVLAILAIVLGAMIMRHDSNLLEHRRKAAEQIALQERNTAYHRAELSAIRRELNEVKSELRNVYLTLLVLTGQQRRQPQPGVGHPP